MMTALLIVYVIGILGVVALGFTPYLKWGPFWGVLLGVCWPLAVVLILFKYVLWLVREQRG